MSLEESFLVEWFRFMVAFSKNYFIFIDFLFVGANYKPYRGTAGMQVYKEHVCNRDYRIMTKLQ